MSQRYRERLTQQLLKSPRLATVTVAKMLITLKTLQQQSFKIDIDEEETVRELSGVVGTEYILTLFTSLKSWGFNNKRVYSGSVSCHLKCTHTFVTIFLYHFQIAFNCLSTRVQMDSWFQHLAASRESWLQCLCLYLSIYIHIYVYVYIYVLYICSHYEMLSVWLSRFTTSVLSCQGPFGRQRSQCLLAKRHPHGWSSRVNFTWTSFLFFLPFDFLSSHICGPTVSNPACQKLEISG